MRELLVRPRLRRRPPPRPLQHHLAFSAVWSFRRRDESAQLPLRHRQGRRSFQLVRSRSVRCDVEGNRGRQVGNAKCFVQIRQRV